MTDPILIVGGGIGGLSASIGLAGAGLPVRVLEQSNSFSEAGAGIQVGPNALRVLRKWDVGDLIAAYAAVPLGIRIYDGIGGELLNTVPLGRRSEERYGAPHIVIRRAHLQRCLLDVAGAHCDVDIQTGFELAGFEDGSTHVEARDGEGAGARGQALIGADGLQSKVRALLDGNGSEPQTVGMTAWRTSVAAKDAPGLLSEPYIGVWMAPYCHLVHYPVEAGEAVDIIAIIEETYLYDGWGAKGEVEDLLPHFHDWHATPLSLLEQLQAWTKWTIYKMNPLKSWGRGRVTLLGDAAHPVQPFLAQGSAMAIEDAAVLVNEIRIRPDDFAAAFRRYEQSRRERTAKVQRASHGLGRVYHYAGPTRWARNAVIRRRKPVDLLARYDWLYGATPEVAA